jgi:hypothetical protein
MGNRKMDGFLLVLIHEVNDFKRFTIFILILL